MMHLPEFLRRQRAQQLVNFNRVKTAPAAATGRLIPTSYPLSPFYEVQEVYVGGRPAVICRGLDPPFDFIDESIKYPALERAGPAHRGLIKRFLRDDLRPGLARPLDLAICLGPGPQLYDAFWHWIYENLLKAVLAEEAGFNGVYLVPPQGYACETLQLIGIAPERIVVNPPGLWKAARLWVSPHVGGELLLRHPEILAKLRAALLRNVAVRRGRERVYISRNRPGMARPIVNEPTFKELIARFGFREYFCEDHSVADQIAFFTGAEAIIGSHGAGFVHALFMPERSLVLSLFPPPRIDTASILPAVQLLKHRYYPVVPPVLGAYPYGEKVEANLDLIEATLARELG
jgi:hypothetical protein